jgi:hypothetical protein
LLLTIALRAAAVRYRRRQTELDDSAPTVWKMIASFGD